MIGWIVVGWRGDVDLWMEIMVGGGGGGGEGRGGRVVGSRGDRYRLEQETVMSENGCKVMLD